MISACLLFVWLVAMCLTTDAFIAPATFATQRAHCSATPRPQSTTIVPSSTALGNKLWKRLEVEEDEEPMWYLLNCVAGLEMDLLRQCRMACEGMEDAIKFVVPTETKTRSHGANRMVTETKVKYQGYVFAKLRLCEEVYEAIQSLDLCRSWMGTVNHKGYKKLPPAPLALNEMEVENFGLEEVEEGIEEKDEMDEDGVIVDSDDEDDKKKQVDEKALEVYQGLRVEDMVKVTTKGKFYDEDGIVRRLKDGKIFVRFYTYGTMFEEWLDPSDVRKLTELEVLRGLSGPTQPITQRDFDGPQVRFDGRRGDGDLRRSLTSTARGGPQQRNRRQDRVANRYGRGEDRDFFGRTEEERRREEKNWNWYKDQQGSQRGGRNVGADDGEWNVRAGSKDSGDWALGDVDSQWGRKPQRQERRERNRVDNRRTEAAIEGNDNWSAFVSSAGDSTGDAKESSDDFFDSLVKDLSNDLGAGSYDNRQSKAVDKSDEDEFFASLMSDLTGETAPAKEPRRKERKSPTPVMEPSAEDDDFFASLQAELGDSLDDDVFEDNGGEADDFFAQLEAELATERGAEPVPTSETAAKHKPESPSAPSPSKSTSPNLEACTVPVLKEMLRERGLKVGGKKSELIERLQSARRD